MKQIRIFCIHPFCKDTVSFSNFMHLDYSDIEFVWDDESPEYLISTETIYSYK